MEIRLIDPVIEKGMKIPEQLFQIFGEGESMDEDEYKIRTLVGLPECNVVLEEKIGKSATFWVKGMVHFDGRPLYVILARIQVLLVEPGARPYRLIFNAKLAEHFNLASSNAEIILDLMRKANELVKQFVGENPGLAKLI